MFKDLKKKKTIPHEKSVITEKSFVNYPFH